MKKLALCLLATVVLTTSALANPSKAGDRFAQIDTDKDNQVSWSEFSIALPQMRESAFQAIDKDKDSKISREEWDTFQSGHSADAKADAKPKSPEKPSIIPPTTN